MNQQNDLIKYSLPNYKDKIISNLQEFLNYKRANSIDFGTRLLHKFKVKDFSLKKNDESFFVEFEESNEEKHANHYWVQKKDLEVFMSGNKEIGVKLFVDSVYKEDKFLIFQINLSKNGFKKPTISEAQKLRGLNIKYNNEIYKSYDVQVSIEKDNYIDKNVRVFVHEQSSAEHYLNNHTVLQNKVEIKNGITFEDFDKQEFFVRKLDAIEAVRMEKKSVITELQSWFMLNLANKLDEDITKEFLKKMNEI